MRKKAASKDTGSSQFTVDLGQIDLTDEELNGFKNQITKLAVESLRKKRKRGPFIKILHVRTIHVRSPRIN